MNIERIKEELARTYVKIEKLQKKARDLEEQKKQAEDMEYLKIIRSLVNETTGKTASGNVTVKGGEKFHLVATTANMGSLKGKYAITSNFPLDFHAMLLKLESSQDIGFGYYTDSSDLQITVDWPEEAVIEITKKDGDTGKNLAGAVYGVYSDNACTKLIAKMPPTDSNGSSRVTLTKTQDTVYLKEITAPEGYVVQASSYGVKLVVGSTTKQTVTDKEQKGNLTVYKEGEVFVGAVSDENGTLFQYEKRRQKGAVYNVYAAEDIVTAGGRMLFRLDESSSIKKVNLSKKLPGKICWQAAWTQHLVMLQVL